MYDFVYNTDSMYISYTDLSSKQELRSLLNESLLMRRFDHPNIVGLLGVCFDTPDGYPYLILPYMINGNVRDYLKDKRVHHTNTAVLPDVSVWLHDESSSLDVYCPYTLYTGIFCKEPSHHVCGCCKRNGVSIQQQVRT